ncbi:MAG: transcription termination/antitermination protein NusG [Ignavibacteria bacterium]|jgi:transcriptional antiterminator NusG|nr:transcription termination/antitermination protein NusG [Ignavibacteria bacterium]
MQDNELENIDNIDGEKADKTDELNEVPAEGLTSGTANAETGTNEHEAAGEEASEPETAGEEASEPETAGKEASEPETTGEESTEKETTDEETASDVYKWYAVRIIAGHENKVKLYLDNNIKEEHFESKIRNVLIPLEKVFEVKNGKKKIKFKNFFPGYILLEADLDDVTKRFLAKIPGLMGIVGAKNVKGQNLSPIPLRDSEIKRIKAILNEESQTEKIDIRLSQGDPVKVTSGPFNNFNGSVLEVNAEKMKVKVMVSIFGRKTPIDLDFTQIEKQK